MSLFEQPQSEEKKGAPTADWAKFRARATELQQASKARQVLSEEEKGRIFSERAAGLRIKKENDDETQEFLQVISFEVAGSYFGVDVHFLQEVYDAEHITAIPCTPPVFIGLLNYRGEVLSVVDLACLLQLKKQRDMKHRSKQSTQAKRVLVVRDADLKAGILVERLHQMLNLPLETIKPLSPFFTRKNKLIRSQARVNGRALLLLDPVAFLQDARLSHCEDV